MLSVAAHCTCAPINHQNTLDEIEEEMKNVGSKLVLMMQGVDNSHVAKAANALGLPIVQLVADEEVSGVFKLEGAPTGAPSEKTYSGKREVALVLHTSGTSGKKKVVPYTLEVRRGGITPSSALSRCSGAQYGGARVACVAGRTTARPLRPKTTMPCVSAPVCSISFSSPTRDRGSWWARRV